MVRMTAEHIAFPSISLFAEFRFVPGGAFSDRAARWAPADHVRRCRWSNHETTEAEQRLEESQRNDAMGHYQKSSHCLRRPVILRSILSIRASQRFSGLRGHRRVGPTRRAQSGLRGGKQGCLDVFDGLVCTHWGVDMKSAPGPVRASQTDRRSDRSRP